MNTDNVSTDEINQFERIAEQWWDEAGPMKLLHQLNPLRLGFVQQHAQLAGKVTLDIGCGAGILAEAMAKEHAAVTAIDMSAACIEVAQKHAQAAGLSIEYQQVTAEHMAAQSGQTYDVITCMEMLEHVPDPASIVRSCADLLKPDGFLFFSTISRTLKSYLLAIVGAEYILKLLPRQTHNYAQFIQPAELAKWARQVGLQLGDLRGMHYNPLTQHFSLSSNSKVNYLMMLQKKSCYA